MCHLASGGRLIGIADLVGPFAAPLDVQIVLRQSRSDEAAPMSSPDIIVSPPPSRMSAAPWRPLKYLRPLPKGSS